jgi:hypothetical protein
MPSVGSGGINDFWLVSAEFLKVPVGSKFISCDLHNKRSEDEIYKY